MKNLKKLIGFMIVFMVLMVAFCSVSFAATVGQPLTSPEDGWKRIDDAAVNFASTNTGIWQSPSDGGSEYFKSTYTCSESKAGDVTKTFSFVGSKFRLISSTFTDRSTNIKIIIDGVEYPVPYANKPFMYSSLVFEKLDLTFGSHTLVFKGGTNYRYSFIFDAIDIDSTGYLIDINQPTNLKAVPGNSTVDLSWNAVEGATSYNIKRSLTTGGQYETIPSNPSNITGTTYPDTSVTNGTTYYYVVTAVVNGTESVPSNEASATPTAPVITGNSGILELTMTNGVIKEYDLTATELQSFIAWYDGRSNGADKAYYMFTKNNNIKPFLSRKEYISFDKISSFEVNEYAE